LKKLILLFSLMLLLSIPVFAAQPEMRGVWVSTVYNLDYPSASALSSAQLKAEADKIIEDAAKCGFNTIFLQVRPCLDAVYPSEIYPWSQFISGTQGAPPDGNFDILDYYIRECHKRAIELHAWINPYRVTVSSFESLEDGLASLSPSNPAVRYSDHVRFGNDKKLYLDPGEPAVRALVADGVSEIIKNYDIDGIHFDDYFYPDAGFDDTVTYIKYGSNFESIGDFRRDNVNKTLELVHNICKNADIPFGVAPFGIWANKTSHLKGSDTRGNQSYYNHYADSLYWVEKGLLDYVAPQLYWEIGSTEGEFETLVLWWKDAVKSTGVNLYIGLAAYRSDDADSHSIWYNGKELKRQLDMLDIYSHTDGVILFRMKSASENEEISSLLSGRFSYPMPEIGPPIFIKNSRSLSILSPSSGSRAVINDRLNVSCLSSGGSSVYALSGNNLSRLMESAEGYTGNINITKTSGILFINNENGVLSVASASLELLSSKNKNALTDIFWERDEEYTKITFITQYPAAADCEIRDNYLVLTVSPCRVGLLFECPDIMYMISEKTKSGVRYTFALDEAPKDYYVEEKKDRIVLYFK